MRTLAIVILFAFGIILLIPGLGDRIEAFGSRIAPGPARVGGDGFGSGLLLGASLGLVYTPCAGPILAGVITVSASQDFTAGKLAVALAYALGSGAVLYVLMLGGRRLVDRLKPAARRVQAATGAVMVVVAVAMTADLDLKFQNAIADDLPSVLVNPSGELEELERRRRRPRRGPRRPRRGAGGRRRARRRPARSCPMLRPGARLRRHAASGSTPGGEPLSIAELTRARAGSC